MYTVVVRFDYDSLVTMPIFIETIVSWEVIFKFLHLIIIVTTVTSGTLASFSQNNRTQLRLIANEVKIYQFHLKVIRNQ